MYDKFNRKRLNTQILTKTEVALETIKRYDLMQQSIPNFNVSNFNASKTLLNQLDSDYSKLTPHRQIVLNHTYKISLLTYAQEFYNLQMMNCIFPMRVMLKNVKNEATIFVGYDQQYPGIYQNNKISIFSDEMTNKQRNYDFKTKISQDMIIVLKNKGNKQIRNVFFTIVGGKYIFLSDFKVQFLGIARDRIQSQVKLKTQLKAELNSQKKKIQTSMPILQRTITQKSQLISQLRQARIKSLKQIMTKTVKLQQLIVFNNEINKHNSKSNLEQNTFKRTDKNSAEYLKTKNLFYVDKNKLMSTNSFNSHKKIMKTQVDYKIQQAKRNKEMIEEYKQKDKQLKQTASKCKKLIENYKKTYHQQDIRKQKLNKDVVLSLYYAIFIKHIFLINQETARKEKLAFRKNYICLKFLKKLKDQHQSSCNMVPYRTKRLVNEGKCGIYILSKMINRQSSIRAEKIIKQTLQFLHPLLLVRQTISSSNKYRTNIKLIQKVWKQKYYNRLRSLLYFVDNHLQKMFKQFPHLKMFYESFYSSNSNRSICLTYIKDQSQKYRFIYQAYMHKIQEINQMIVANNSVKKKLDIPKKPTRPMHRFYRNLDILKSMVRTWFEIEYKKFTKKSSKKIYY